MGPSRVLSAKRLREHLVLFTALLGVVALVSGLSVGVIGFLAQSANEGVRAGLASRAGAERALRATLQLDDDAEKQDAEVRAAITKSLHGLPMDIDRTVSARADVSTIVDDVAQNERRTQVLSIPGLPERADLVDGSWPTSPDEVSLQAHAAERLGVVPGDRLQLGRAVVTVTATWTVKDPLDPRWIGDRLLTEGSSELDADFGPVIIDESLWPQLEVDPRARWTIVPDIARISAGDLAAIVDAWNGINVDWRGEVSSNLITLEKQGRFKRAALEIGSRVDALQAIQPVVLLLLAAIALVTLAELGRLLTTTRSTEIALLWSRGATALDIARTTALETALAGVVGAGLGTGAALGALALALTPEAVGTVGTAIWAVPLAVTIAAVLVIAGSAFRSARRQTVRDPGEGAGRARRLAGPGLVVLATAAAALAVWQLRLYGSPLTPTTDGGTDVDPIAVMAPALTLLAVVLLGLVLFPRVASLDELATRRAHVARILAARTVSRRLQLVAAPIVVVAMATSTLVVASAYAATWSDSFRRTSELRAGGPLHVSTGYPGVDAATIIDLRDVAGVDGVSPVDLETLQLGSESGSIVGVTPATIAQVATPASGSFDREAVAAAVDTDVPGPTLPDGTSAVTLTTIQQGFTEPPRVSAQVLDGFGVLWEVPFETPTDDGPAPDEAFAELGFHEVSYSGVLPAQLDDAPVQILALDLSLSGAAVPIAGIGQFVLRQLTADGQPIELDKFWLPETPTQTFALPPLSDYAGLGVMIGPDSRLVRMTPTFDDDVSDRSTPPVAISQRLADDFDLKVGDPLSFALEDAYERTNATVAMIVPAIPGADVESAVMVDLGLVLHDRLRVKGTPDPTRDLWVNTADPDAVAAALRLQLPANTRMQTSDDSSGRVVLGSAATALWLGALGCLVLAVIAIVAVVRAQLRARRLDVVVLRAIGLSARDQSKVRRRELGLVLGYGLAIGAVAGLAVSVLTVPQLARAAVVEPYSTVPTPLYFDPLGLALGAAALVIALLVIVAVYTTRVAVQARTAIGSEEVT
jgi:hypothetical protein